MSKVKARLKRAVLPFCIMSAAIALAFAAVKVKDLRQEASYKAFKLKYGHCALLESNYDDKSEIPLNTLYQCIDAKFRWHR